MIFDWKVSKCCCYDLKIGSLIIAQVDLSFEIAALIITLVKVLLSNQRFTIYIGIGIVLAIFSIISCLYLKKGILEDNAKYFHSWIVSKVIVLTVALIIMVSFGVTIVTNPPDENDPYTVQQLIFIEALLIVAFALNLYTFTVVRSYLAFLKRGEEIV